MRIGILGGTFDPVHNAHLAMARAALERLALDRILFIPTGAPRYRNPALASPEHRLAMLRLALAGEPRCGIDERELAAGASGYTADTLRSLRAEFPAAELVLLIGADQHAKLGSWHAPAEVARLATIAVFARPGWKIEGGVPSVPLAPMAISASEIRARAARGEDVTDAVPPAVAAYIARHALYR